MIAGLPRQPVTVLGIEVPESDVDLVVNSANEAQSALDFRFDRRATPSRSELNRYALPNGGYDLDRWLTGRLARGMRRDGWLLLITGLPYGEPGRGTDAGGLFYFGCDDDQHSAVISTHLWSELDSTSGALAPNVSTFHVCDLRLCCSV